MDLGAIGYISAADAIAETLAENSMKLIALKGLLEEEMNKNGNQSFELTQESIKSNGANGFITLN